VDLKEQIKIRVDIEKNCPSLTKEEQRLLGNSIIENHSLMKELSKL